MSAEKNRAPSLKKDSAELQSSIPHAEWETIVNRHLKPNASWVVFCYQRSESTMELARAILPSLSANRAGLVLSQQQYHGRGRQGRRWQAAEQSLAVTYVFPTAAQATQLSAFSLVVGVVTAELLESLGFPIKLKWPNDLMSVSGKKLGGILIEVTPRVGNANVNHQDTSQFVLVGIGINLSGAPQLSDDDSTARKTAALSELSGAAVPAAPLLAAKLGIALQVAWQEFLARGFQGFMSRWAHRHLLTDCALSIDVGDRIVAGICRGIDSEGRLLVEHEGAIYPIISGHVQ